MRSCDRMPMRPPFCPSCESAVMRAALHACGRQQAFAAHGRCMQVLTGAVNTTSWMEVLARNDATSAFLVWHDSARACRVLASKERKRRELKSRKLPTSDRSSLPSSTCLAIGAAHHAV